jgi:predicted RecA/RadA family phage recombinase
MKTYLHEGKVLELTAPSGGVVTGTAYLIGGILVVATATVAEALPFQGLVVGVVDLPKEAEEGWSEGLKVYWDDTEKKVTATSGSNTLIGVAVPPIVPRTVVITSEALAADLAIDNDALTVQVLDYAQLGSDNAVVTVTINGVDHDLTEGTDWTAATNDEDTADSLKTAIAALDGVNATVATDTVTVVPASGITLSDATIGRVRLQGAA